MTALELQLEPIIMVKQFSGIGTNEWTAKVKAMVKIASLDESLRRAGKEYHVISCTEAIKYRERYKVYHCIISVDYEVIE